jgi:hypothetical protein
MQSCWLHNFQEASGLAQSGAVDDRQRQASRHNPGGETIIVASLITVPPLTVPDVEQITAVERNPAAGLARGHRGRCRGRSLLFYC